MARACTQPDKVARRELLVFMPVHAINLSTSDACAIRLMRAVQCEIVGMWY